MPGTLPTWALGMGMAEGVFIAGSQKGQVLSLTNKAEPSLRHEAHSFLIHTH
jgi:hypothetical protein